jgi:hypothetical protein
MADREGRSAQDYSSLYGQQDSRADTLAKLADLHGRGAISEADYQRGKDKVLSGTGS